MSQGQIDLFAPPTGRQRRDAALQQVADHTGPTWMERVQEGIVALPSGSLWTGETLRFRLEDDFGPPHHYNAWGAVMMTAIKRGVMVETGERWVTTRTVSHARKLPVYRRNT